MTVVDSGNRSSIILSVTGSRRAGAALRWQTFGRPHAGSARFLIAGILIFAATYVALYPRVTAIADEDAYLTQAWLFRSGRLSYEGSPIPPSLMTVAEGARLVSKYPPGNTLWLLPFTLAGWRGVFASGLVLAVAGTILFFLVLRRLDPVADPALALLWLCYPTVVLFSRTVMSDLLAATAVLLALYALLRRGNWLVVAGLALGFAVLVRYSNAILVPVFLVLALRPRPGRARAAALLGTGLVPFVALAGWYNTVAFGAPLAFPMYLTGFFAPVFFPGNAGYYAVNLLLLYPLMLVAPFFAGRGRRLLLGLPAAAVLLVYCFFSFIHESPNLAERLLLGMRYLLPALPFFILAWALAAGNLVAGLRLGKAIKYAGIGLLLALSVAVQFRHDRYLRVQDGYRRLLYQRLPADALLVANSDAAELVGYAWGPRRRVLFAEFNLPMPVYDTIATSPVVYAALLEKPGDDRLPERSIFEGLIARFPGRELVATTASPYRFRLYRLKPAAAEPPPTAR
jgi:4-amino-4-deoxy-L-arabinose transferase-like glycosyltransferase